MQIYEHIEHPCTTLHLTGRAPKPPKVNDGRVGLNGRIGLLITTLVGTMVAGYVFAIIALISLPSAITSHNLTVIIAWVSSNFLQLVLLPVIIVGQNLQAKATDTRAMQTYEDAEAVLHEAVQIQQHLAAQDAVLGQLIAAAKAAAGHAGDTSGPAGAIGTAGRPGRRLRALDGPVQARGVQRRGLRGGDHAARAQPHRGGTRPRAPHRSAPRALAGLPGLPDQLLHDRHRLGQPSCAGQVDHRGRPDAALPQPGPAPVRRADPVRHCHGGGLLPA